MVDYWRGIRVRLLFLLCTLLVSVPVYSDELLKFAVVPQGVGNEFFEDVKKGCEQAASDLGGVECHYGGPDKADVRAQSQYINSLIKQGIDGVAVSVIDSNYLASEIFKNVKESNIPFISFNSGFEAEALISNPNLSRSYVGTNNFQFGWELGMLVREFRPTGGRLCLISGHKQSPALQNRMSGVRAALMGMPALKVIIDPLAGENGWTEYSRCPFYSNDLPNRALTQLIHVLKKNEHEPQQVDTAIVVGAWPQQDEEAYREALISYKETLATKKMVIVIGDSMEQQIRLLHEKLAHANIGQNPYQMGYQSIVQLKNLAKGRSVPNLVYTPMIKCLPDREPVCSE